MKQANTIPTPANPRKSRVKKSPSESLSEPYATPAAAPASAETLLHVDLWTDNASPAAGAFQPVAAQMVNDLILGSSGTIQACSDNAVYASYGSTRQAIAAVRKLCGLIDGFSSTADTAAVHAAFTLCHAGDSESLSLRDTSQTEPQRVLLIGAICQAARTIPGLRFRELPAPGQAPHCTTIELLTPPHHVPAVSPQPAALAAAAPTVPTVKPRPVAGPPQKSVAPPPAKLPIRTPSAVPQQSSPAPDPKRRMLTFAGAGVAGLVVIGGIVFALRPTAKPQPAAAPITAAAALPAVTPQPQPTTIAPVAPAPKSSTPIEPRRQPTAPPKVKQPTPPPDHQAAPPPSSSGVTFSPDEIRRMIANADKLAGDGHYDRAITLYDAVLKADRKNAAALAGRQRAVYNRDHI